MQMYGMTQGYLSLTSLRTRGFHSRRVSKKSGTYNRRLLSACHLWWFLYTVTISGATANAIRTAPKTGLNITHPRAVASKVVVRAKDTCMLAKPKLSGPRTEG